MTLARSRPALSFYGLAVAIALGVIVFSIVYAVVDPASLAAIPQLVGEITEGPGYVNIISIGAVALNRPVLFAIFVFAAAPTIAALVIAALGGGGGLRALLTRLKPFGAGGATRDRIAFYALLIGIYFFGLFFTDWIAGPGVDAYVRLNSIGGTFVIGALVALVLDEGGTLEELGWRGFLWPILQDAFRSPVLAALLVGAMHWAWHLPREIPNLLGGAPLSAWATGQLFFLLLCALLSIVACYCVNASGGSVWPAVFVHGGTNAWGKATTDVFPSLGYIDVRLIMLVILSTLIVIFARHRLGRADV